MPQHLFQPGEGIEVELAHFRNFKTVDSASRPEVAGELCSPSSAAMPGRLPGLKPLASPEATAATREARGVMKDIVW
jgi:hypothetical protein